MSQHQRIPIITDLSERSCFGCGQDNPIGLKLIFKKEGDEVKAEFVSAKIHEGWPGILHGGIIASLLDEGMGWAARLFGYNCVTARLEVSFRRPIPVSKRLIITGKVTGNTGRRIGTEARILLPDGTLMAEGTGTHVIIKMEKEAQKE